MRLRVLVFSFIAGVVLFAPASALAAGDSGCCGEKACAMNAPCCTHEGETAACCNHDGDKAAAGVRLPLPTAPARQTAVVWFHKPVQVGDAILLGKYIIEHDNDRMAQGLPCTHIYAADKPQVPVVKFHCTHLEATANPRDLVILRPTGDASIPAKFVSFQFAGEAGAHGFPSGR
jgi:hypothetical protein